MRRKTISSNLRGEPSYDESASIQRIQEQLQRRKTIKMSNKLNLQGGGPMGRPGGLGYQPTSIDEVIEQAARRDKALKEKKEAAAVRGAGGAEGKEAQGGGETGSRSAETVSRDRGGKKRKRRVEGEKAAGDGGQGMGEGRHGGRQRLSGLGEEEEGEEGQPLSRLQQLRKLGTMLRGKSQPPRCKTQLSRSAGTEKPSGSAEVSGPALRRARNIRDLVIEPEQFTVDKILMLLDIKRLKKLGQEFENIIDHDKEMQEEEKKRNRSQILQKQHEKVIINKISTQLMGQMGYQVPKVPSQPPKLNASQRKDSILFQPLSAMVKVSDQGSEIKRAASNVYKSENKAPADGETSSMKNENQRAMPENGDDEDAEGLSMSQFVRVMLKILVDKPKQDRIHLVDCSSDDSAELSKHSFSSSNSDDDDEDEDYTRIKPRKDKGQKPVISIDRSQNRSLNATRSVLARSNNYGKKDKPGTNYDDDINAFVNDDEIKKGKIITGTTTYYNLIYGLCQMFEEIDINGDGTMEWTELMQFLLDTVNQRDKMTLDVQFQQDAQYGNRQNMDRMIKGKSKEIKSNARRQGDEDLEEQYESKVSKISGASEFSFISDFSDVVKAKKNLKHKFLADILQKFQRSKFSPYHESETIIDRMSHRSPIAKCIYSQRHCRFIMFEAKDPTCFTIAKEQMSQNMQGGRPGSRRAKERKDMATQVIEEDQIHLDFKKKSFILDMAYSEKHQILGLVASDGRIYFYQSKDDDLRLRSTFIIDASELTLQTNIWYMDRHDVWLTAGKDFVLREWSINGPSNTFADKQVNMNPSSFKVKDGKQNKPQRSKSYTQQIKQVSQANSLYRQQFLSEFRKKPFNAQTEEYFWNGFLVHEYRANRGRGPSIHTDVIMDICEIQAPLLIATASLDKLIRLISLQEQKEIGKFSGHLKGVRQLDYTPYMDGYILSVGHESFVNVWTLDGGRGAIQSSVSLGNKKKSKHLSNLYGKLAKGHNLMKYARFLHNSSFCATVDEKFVCKLWKFTTLELLQSIQPYPGLRDINGMITFKGWKRFAIACKRLIFFDVYTINQLINQRNPANEATSSQPGGALQQFGKRGARATQSNQIREIEQSISVPIGADFEMVNNNFVIVTASDIRIYCGATGQLLKIFSDVQDSRSNSELKSFCFDSRHRKIIVGDADGTVRMLNLSNGVKISTLTNRNDAEFEKKRAEGIFKDRNKEISSIEVVKGFDPGRNDVENGKEDKSKHLSTKDHDLQLADASLVITASWDALIKVYDEKKNNGDGSDEGDDDPYSDDDEDVLPLNHHKRRAEVKNPDDKLVLRQINGANFNDLVVSMTVSKHHSLIATGMQSGLVTIWDLQTGKCDRVHQAAKSSINLLSFVDQYPMLVAGGAQGYMSVWATSRAPKDGRDLRYQCMGRFINQNRMMAGGDLQEGITCGALKVVKVGIKNQIFQSDQIMFDDSSFSIRTSLKRQQNTRKDTEIEEGEDKQTDLDKFIEQEIQPHEEVLDNTQQKLIDEIQKIKIEMEEGQRSTIENNNLRALDTIAYDRIVTIIGTDSGFIKLWDLTYMTQQKSLKKPAANTINSLIKGLQGRIHRQKEKSEDYKRKKIIEQTMENKFIVDSSGQIIKLEKIETPVYQAPKISYNPWSRSSTNLDPHSAKSFLKQALDADFKIDQEESNTQNFVQQTLDAKHGLEMQFMIHNAEQYYKENYLKKDNHCNHKHDHQQILGGKHTHKHHSHGHKHQQNGVEGQESGEEETRGVASKDSGEEWQHDHAHSPNPKSRKSGGHLTATRQNSVSPMERNTPIFKKGTATNSDDNQTAARGAAEAQMGNINVYKHLYDSGDEEEIKRKRDGCDDDSSSECISHGGQFSKRESNYRCQGVIKAHEMAVNSIRIFEHNGAVSFVTSSDDMFVKIFSLQKFKLGAINVQNIGVINLRNPYNHNNDWLFPFDNTDMIYVRKNCFKKVLVNVFANRAGDKMPDDPDQAHGNYKSRDQIEQAVENLRITIVDPRKEQLDHEEELKQQKKHQELFISEIIKSQSTFVHRDRITRKLLAMKKHKIDKQMAVVHAVESQLVIGSETNNKQVHFPKIRDLNQKTMVMSPTGAYRSKSAQASSDRKQSKRDYDMRSPTSLKLNQFGTNLQKILFENTIRGQQGGSQKYRLKEAGNKGSGKDGDEAVIQKSMYEEELQAQQNQNKLELRKFIKDLNYHDQESYPFTRQDLEITNLMVDQDAKLKMNMRLSDKPEPFSEAEKKLPSQKRPQPKIESPFHKERKKWHLGHPDAVGIHHKPIYSIGEIQISKLEHNKQVQKTIRQQQMQLKQNFEQIHEENQQKLREQAEQERKKQNAVANKGSVLALLGKQTAGTSKGEGIIKLQKVQSSKELNSSGLAPKAQTHRKKQSETDSTIKLAPNKDSQKMRAGSVVQKDKSGRGPETTAAALGLVKSATSEGILKQRSAFANRSVAAGDKKSTSNVEFGGGTADGLKKGGESANQGKGSRTETPKTILGSIMESSAFGDGGKNQKGAAGIQAGILGNHAKSQLHSLLPNTKKLETPKTTDSHHLGGSQRVSLMEVYKDFLKQAINDTEKLQMEAGVESFTHRELKYKVGKQLSTPASDIQGRHKSQSQSSSRASKVKIKLPDARDSEAIAQRLNQSETQFQAVGQSQRSMQNLATFKGLGDKHGKSVTSLQSRRMTGANKDGSTYPLTQRSTLPDPVKSITSALQSQTSMSSSHHNKLPKKSQHATTTPRGTAPGDSSRRNTQQLGAPGTIHPKKGELASVAEEMISERVGTASTSGQGVGSGSSVKNKTLSSFSQLALQNSQRFRGTIGKNIKLEESEEVSRQKQRVMAYNVGGTSKSQLLKAAMTSSQYKGMQIGDKSPAAKVDSLYPTEIYYWRNSDQDIVGLKQPKQSKYLGAIQVNLEKEKEKSSKIPKSSFGKFE